jgi:hypothetical protein
MILPYAEPYKMKMIESIKRSTRVEREDWIRKAKYCLFQLKSEQVYIDLLTDALSVVKQLECITKQNIIISSRKRHLIHREAILRQREW